MNKQPEITDGTREAFITAFFRLTKSKNMYRITIKEITDLAGYNRTTFYRYFADVYALIEYTEDELINHLLTALLGHLDQTTVIDDNFFHLFLDAFKTNKEKLIILLNEQNRTSFIHRLQNRLVENLNIPITKSSKNDVIMEVYYTGIFSAIATHLQNPNKISDEELFDILKSLFANWFWPEITK